MRLTLPYPPQANHLYTIARGRKILSAQGRAYKQLVARILTRHRPVSGDISVLLDVYRPRRSGDLDNTLKAVLDSVKGLIWHDDKQVVEIHARRFDDKTNPRVEIDFKQVTKTRCEDPGLSLCTLETQGLWARTEY